MSKKVHQYFYLKRLSYRRQLARAVRRTKLTPAELFTTAFVVIENCGRNKDSFNLSLSYITKRYNSITKKNFTFKQTWTAPKNLLVYLYDKTIQTWDGSSTEKRLFVSVSRKKKSFQEFLYQKMT